MGDNIRCDRRVKQENYAYVLHVKGDPGVRLTVISKTRAGNGTVILRGKSPCCMKGTSKAFRYVCTGCQLPRTYRIRHCPDRQ